MQAFVLCFPVVYGRSSPGVLAFVSLNEIVKTESVTVA